jgi:ElaB/YqjD/DUF883 family membrane-anchored ribosome-binding protein
MTITESFKVYNFTMNKIYEELSLIKESHNPEYKLILEGFWDKVKGAAKGIGNAVGKGVGHIKNAVDGAREMGKKAIEKGKELGQKALDAGKKLMSDISTNVSNTIDYIKKAPAAIMDKVSSMLKTASENAAKMYAEAVEKGGKWLENAKSTIKRIYDKIAGGLSNSYNFVKNWVVKNAESAAKAINAKIESLSNSIKAAKQSSNGNLQKIGNFFAENLPKIANNAKEIAKNAGLIALGLIVLPFFGAYLILKKVGNMGEEAFKFIESGLNIIKTNLGESWDLAVNAYKEGEQSVREAYKADNNNRIYSFTEFVNEKYNRINIAK